MKRFGLSAEERIKSGKDFEKIFSNGQAIFSSDKKIKAIFILEKVRIYNSGVKISIAINKKNGNAVWRNRVKRLLKEAYRLNKEIIRETVLKKNILLKIVFFLNNYTEYKNKKIHLSEVTSGMAEILMKLKNRM